MNNTPPKVPTEIGVEYLREISWELQEKNEPPQIWRDAISHPPNPEDWPIIAYFGNADPKFKGSAAMLSNWNNTFTHWQPLSKFKLRRALKSIPMPEPPQNNPESEKSHPPEIRDLLHEIEINILQESKDVGVFADKLSDAMEKVLYKSVAVTLCHCALSISKALEKNP